MDDSEQPVASAAGRAISIRRNVLLAWIAAAAALAAAIGGMTAYLAGHSEVSRLQAAIRKLEGEKGVMQRQYDDLRRSYGQMIAKERCEVIDGMDDCLAAGLTRPQRFADADRQLVEARHAKELQRAAEEAVLEAKKARPVRKADNKQPAQSSSGKISLGEFLEEIKKIPGVGVDPVQKEGDAGEKRDRVHR